MADRRHFFLPSCSFFVASWRQAAFLPAALLLLVVGNVVAQEEDDDEDLTPKYDQFVKIRQWKYLPPGSPTAKQAIQFKLDIHPDVPKGARINFELEYQGLPVRDTTDLLIKDNRRAGVGFNWEFPVRLPLDEYFLRTRLYFERQTPEVQEKIRSLARKFPMEDQPWPWYFVSQPIRIGTDAELAEEQLAICDAYDALIARLIDNMFEVVDGMEAVKEGKQFVSGGKLDTEEFAAFIVAWRKKQGAVQKEIREFPVTHSAYFQKTRKAHYTLTELGQMVSKRSFLLQKEVTQKYKVGHINPLSDPHFDRNYRFKVSRQQLKVKHQLILGLVCPPEEEPLPEDEAGAGGDAKKDKKGE